MCDHARWRGRASGIVTAMAQRGIRNMGRSRLSASMADISVALSVKSNISMFAAMWSGSVDSGMRRTRAEIAHAGGADTPLVDGFLHGLPRPMYVAHGLVQEQQIEVAALETLH